LVDNYVDGRGKFERWEAAEIAEVIRKTVADFEAVADVTERAASSWRQDNGPAAAVTKLLQLVELNAPIVNDQSKMSSWSDGIEDAAVAGLIASCKALRPIWLEVKRRVRQS
jgi:hypothetical protein